MCKSPCSCFTATSIRSYCEEDDTEYGHTDSDADGEKHPGEEEEHTEQKTAGAADEKAARRLFRQGVHDTLTYAVRMKLMLWLFAPLAALLTGGASAMPSPRSTQLALALAQQLALLDEPPPLLAFTRGALAPDAGHCAADAAHGR